MKKRIPREDVPRACLGDPPSRDEAGVMKDQVLSLHLEKPFCASFGKSARRAGTPALGRVEEKTERAGSRQGRGLHQG